MNTKAPLKFDSEYEQELPTRDQQNYAMAILELGHK